MRVILLQDVPKVGKKYEIKEIANGLARNFILPRKLGEFATAGAIKKIELLKAKQHEEKEKELQALKGILAALPEKMSVHVKANEQGNLFKAVAEKEIAHAILKQYGIIIDSEKITLHDPIKKIGVYEITVGEGSEQKNCSLMIEAEEKNT